MRRNDWLTVSGSKIGIETGIGHQLGNALDSPNVLTRSDILINLSEMRVIAYGVVIRGETTHYELISESTAQGLMQVSVSEKKPIGFGLIASFQLIFHVAFVLVKTAVFAVFFRVIKNNPFR